MNNGSQKIALAISKCARTQKEPPPAKKGRSLSGKKLSTAPPILFALTQMSRAATSPPPGESTVRRLLHL